MKAATTMITLRLPFVCPYSVINSSCVNWSTYPFEGSVGVCKSRSAWTSSAALQVSVCFVGFVMVSSTDQQNQVPK